MRTFALETAKLLTLLALIIGGLSLHGTGRALFMAGPQRETYLLERQLHFLEKDRLKRPDSIAIHEELAEVYDRLCRTQDVLRMQKRLIELAPDNHAHYQAHANTVAVMRTDAAKFYDRHLETIPALAIELYKSAIELAPEDQQLAREYAMMFYLVRSGSTKEAIEAWTHVSALATEEQVSKEAHLHLARWLGTEGKIGAARKHLRLANGYENAGLVTATNGLLDRLAIEEKETRKSRLLAKNRQKRKKGGRQWM